MILTMRAVQVTLMTQNYPGRLHIPVCIIPCARYSATNRLVFHSASRQPLLPHYRGPHPTHAHHRLSTQRQTLYSFHRSGLFRRFHSFCQASSTSPRHFPHEPGRLPCGIHIGFYDSCRSLCRRFRERFPSFFRLCPHHAWFPSRPLVASAGPHPVHVRHRFLTRSLFAPRSC